MSRTENDQPMNRANRNGAIRPELARLIDALAARMVNDHLTQKPAQQCAKRPRRTNRAALRSSHKAA